jgi:hypothetical protein
MASITATTSGPCGCCAPAPTGCFTVRQKIGSSGPCGFLVMPPPPLFIPTFYRTATQSGSLVWCNQSNDCLTDNDQWQVDFSGSCYFDVMTCVLTQAGQAQFYQSSGVCGSSMIAVSLIDVCGVYPADATGTPWPAGPQANLAQNAPSGTLRESYTITSGCIPYPGAHATPSVATAQLVFSDQDMPTDSYARAVAAEAAASWSAYASVSTPHSSQCAINIESAGGFSPSTYAEQEWKIEETGLTPTTTYYATVLIYRSTDGTTWSLYQTLSVSGITDGSGNLLITGYTANDLGYHDYADCDCVLTT